MSIILIDPRNTNISEEVDKYFNFVFNNEIYYNHLYLNNLLYLNDNYDKNEINKIIHKYIEQFNYKNNSIIRLLKHINNINMKVSFFTDNTILKNLYIDVFQNNVMKQIDDFKNMFLFHDTINKDTLENVFKFFSTYKLLTGESVIYHIIPNDYFGTQIFQNNTFSDEIVKLLEITKTYRIYRNKSEYKNCITDFVSQIYKKFYLGCLNFNEDDITEISYTNMKTLISVIEKNGTNDALSEIIFILVKILKDSNFKKINYIITQYWNKINLTEICDYINNNKYFIELIDRNLHYYSVKIIDYLNLLSIENKEYLVEVMQKNVDRSNDYIDKLNELCLDDYFNVNDKLLTNYLSFLNNINYNYTVNEKKKRFVINNKTFTNIDEYNPDICYYDLKIKTTPDLSDTRQLDQLFDAKNKDVTLSTILFYIEIFNKKMDFKYNTIFNFDMSTIEFEDGSKMTLNQLLKLKQQE